MSIMGTVLKIIHKGHLVVLAELFVAVAGTALRVVYVRRYASSSPRIVGTATWVFVLLGHRNILIFYLFHLVSQSNH